MHLKRKRKRETCQCAHAREGSHMVADREEGPEAEGGREKEREERARVEHESRLVYEKDDKDEGRS